MSVRVSRLLHAGYLFEAEGARILFDPIFESPFSVNCHAFPAARFDAWPPPGFRADAVFISHFHDDHCSLESLDRLDRGTPIHLFCRHAELFELIRALGFRDVRSLEWDRPVRVGPFEVRAWRALDADVDSILSVRAGGVAILNVVDSWIDDEILSAFARTDWDLVLWPFQTMRELEALCPARGAPAERGLPPEWKAQLTVLKPRAVVPSSCQFKFEPWSWLNRAYFPISYERFARELAELLPSCVVWRLDPGQAVELTPGTSARAPELPGLGLEADRGGDYEYDESAPVPSSAEIASRFAAPSNEERRRLEEFLHDGLARRWAELSPWEEGFFSRSRHWRLALFDQHGGERVLDYRVEGAAITRMTAELSESSSPDWRTEISAAKLIGALERGETLTSLYARVIPPLEKSDEPEIDLFEDPLLRVLYEGRPFAYQRAQLERILSRTR